MRAGVTDLANRTRQIAKEHWALLILMLLGMIPFFYGLGDDYLWEDEGDTAVLARNILQFGVPKAWDGVTFIDSDRGARENEDLIMVSHPWMQYYLTAASFCLFGENTFAARFPFALSGFLTLPLVYVLMLRMTRNRRIAFCACVLLALSVQFLLFSRQCRNYALNTFLTTLLLVQFFELKNLRRTLAFSATAIVLFHSHPSGLAPVGALVAVTLFYEPFRPLRRWAWLSIPIICTLTLPWFSMADDGYRENTALPPDITTFAARLLQFFIECGSVTPVVAVILLFLWSWVQQKKRSCLRWRDGGKISHAVLAEGERDLVTAIIWVTLAYSLMIALTTGRSNLWIVGLRHTPVMIPFVLMITSIFIVKVVGNHVRLYAGFMFVLAFTKIGTITPWSFLHDKMFEFDDAKVAAMHVPNSWQSKLFRTGLPAFSRDILQRNRGSISYICEFLNSHAAPGEVLITNYGWEPIYFHTHLPQGLKVLPSYPIYDTAQDHQLPGYVFTTHQARWIVWRPEWKGYQDYHWQAISDSLKKDGASLKLVASIPETLWENRANIHFRRFPENDYIFPYQERTADIQIYRVDWPWDDSDEQQATTKDGTQPRAGSSSSASDG